MHMNEILTQKNIRGCMELEDRNVGRGKVTPKPRSLRFRIDGEFFNMDRKKSRIVNKNS